MSHVRRTLRALRRAVTPAVKAEQEGDYIEVVRLRSSIEAARVDLMRMVNSALNANDVGPIDFD
ncbi:hypothetical protein StoSoilB22_17890 [Arthrobacter sp. StoSoilB22]|nr:hypothetical protein StoSoilB22_17890 [Arthrobacter sp. StoSoilB22]